MIKIQSVKVGGKGTSSFFIRQNFLEFWLSLHRKKWGFSTVESPFQDQ